MTREEREKRNAEMREYKAQGHSMKEVAERFSYSEALASQICKGIAPLPKTGMSKEKREEIRLRELPKYEEAATKTIAERAQGFEYVDGYTNCDGRVNIRCKVCGHVQSRSFITIRHKNIVCENCAHIEAEKRKAHKKLVEAQKKEWEKIGKVKAEQLSFSVCKACGSLFFPSRQGLLYCSTKCRTKENDAIKKDKRIRKLRTIAIDRDITIEKLYKKSNGVCALCGGQCDWSDHVINDGTFVVGAMYPSIDHVKPISRGGLHEWSNVQLAHFSCNSKKGDRA